MENIQKKSPTLYIYINQYVCVYTKYTKNA